MTENSSSSAAVETVANISSSDLERLRNPRKAAQQRDEADQPRTARKLGWQLISVFDAYREAREDRER